MLRAELSISSASTWTDKALMFTSPTGVPAAQQLLPPRVAARSGQAGLPGIHFRDLRHTFSAGPARFDA